MNSSERCASAFSPSFPFSQYSIALTSWLVSASMSLILPASASENPATSFSNAALVCAEKGFSSLIER